MCCLEIYGSWVQALLGSRPWRLFWPSVLLSNCWQNCRPVTRVNRNRNHHRGGGGLGGGPPPPLYPPLPPPPPHTPLPLPIAAIPGLFLVPHLPYLRGGVPTFFKMVGASF